jgi:hypothetical protein
MHARALALLAIFHFPAVADTYDLTWRLSFDVEKKIARGSVTVGEHEGRLREIDFNVGSAFSGIKADGELEKVDGRAKWAPPPEGGTFRYKVKIEEERGDGIYRSYFPGDWAIFRGDRVFPSARVRALGTLRSKARLIFDIPESWHASTPYRPTLNGEHSFVVDRPQRRFDRPVGWMMVGRLGTRSDDIAGTRLVIAAPRGEQVRRMDMLTLLSYTLPAMDAAFGRLPKKILIALAPDPMWRGGLSGPNSLYLHADRPMISGNGTSPLLHELIHVITEIHGKKSDDDWIAEGLAEYYSIDILHRTGGMTDERVTRLSESLADWSASVSSLRAGRSHGPVTAKAVLLLMDVNAELARLTDGQKDLDDLTRRLIRMGDVSTADFIRSAEEIAGAPLESLTTPLLEHE